MGERGLPGALPVQLNDMLKKAVWDVVPKPQPREPRPWLERVIADCAKSDGPTNERGLAVERDYASKAGRQKVGYEAAQGVSRPGRRPTTQPPGE